MRKVEVQDSHIAFDDVYKVEVAHLRFEKFNGQMSDTIRRLIFERGDSVAALIFNTDTQKVILTNQFRYPVYKRGPGWLHETVAGVIDEGEQPEEAIRREIREEIGYETHALVPIATFYVSPGGSSERISLYYAEVSSADQISAGGGLVSENEDIALVQMTLPELWQALDNGAIIDAKTLIAAQWLRWRLQ